MIPSSKFTTLFHSLEVKKRKKNDYLKLQEGAYPRMFVEQLETAVEAVATGKLAKTRMVKRNPRTGNLELKFGFGKRNTYFENGYIAQGDVPVFSDTEALLKVLTVLLQAARSGEFDDALNKLCRDRQVHAATMIEARDVCGFHRKPKNPDGSPEVMQ